MKKPYPFLLLLFLCFAPGSAESSISASKPYTPDLPFAPGERLVYGVEFNETPMGEAILEVREEVQMKGRAVYHLLTKIKANRFVSLFTKVDDQIESYIDTDELYPHLAKINKRRRNGDQAETVVFDQVQHQAVQLKNDRQEVYSIPPNAQDILSVLYFLRSEDALATGSARFLDVTQNRKNWRLEARVLRRDRLSIPTGIFDTIQIQMTVPDGGLLMGEGTLSIWLTDDSRRIPVMMKSEGKRGVITATLSSL